jgi:hypothetical protein
LFVFVNFTTMNFFDVKFKNPASILVSGCTGSGKSTLVFNMLKYPSYFFSNMECMKTVVLYYKEYQDIYDEFQHLITEFINESPTYESVRDKVEFCKEQGSIVIIDDFADDLDPSVRSLFGVGAHHFNSHIFLLTQYLYPRKPAWFSDVTANAIYVIYFKNPKNMKQINRLIYQCIDGDAKWAINAVKDTLREAHSYILFDFHQTTPETLKLRTNILPHEFPMICFTKRK